MGKKKNKNKCLRVRTQWESFDKELKRNKETKDALTVGLCRECVEEEEQDDDDEL